ncbi:NAD(P)(+) transhydrogenase (Re/Si-specific) subunit beta [Phaeacidiphilus oryzae]|uniref:NAD(P)(+) transhydrogenase (Re/Si-specific) subunit beta n=1 Tax=Phaeacidiphilus oryzae TaxID=348818 RepID=UPI0005684344|nr:NAD(P)(+) transhydrogenase (Re/Si-specific) subunit beta [Phaeacidiphilus oryzae]
MNSLDAAVRYVLLAAAACFVVGLHLMNTPRTARRGNAISAAAMAVAVLATAVLLLNDGAISGYGWLVLLLGGALGSAAGLYSARRVAMTAMPQLVSLFNAVGGGAAVLITVTDLLQTSHPAGIAARTTVPGALDIVIGAVTFSGSLIAAGKLQGLVPGRPIGLPALRTACTFGLPLMFVAGLISVLDPQWLWLSAALLPALGLAFGVAMVLPIGGADMPVVISLLNACTGTAVAMAGFVLDEPALITAGALVGASGGILTKLMADAMNRSIVSIIVGGFGTGDEGPVGGEGAGDARVRSLSVDDAAIQLAYAERVMIVPGYGLAAAQAQHELGDLAQLLEEHGVQVRYAVHPVAGRMPGHMNVLLAEADVPYPQLLDLEEANPAFPQTDVSLVVGANDVTNPAARRPGNPVSGMPVLDVDRSKNVIVIKRSMAPGYAGIDNELYTAPQTGMLFSDAKQALSDLRAAVRTFVA